MDFYLWKKEIFTNFDHQDQLEQLKRIPYFIYNFNKIYKNNKVLTMMNFLVLLTAHFFLITQI